MSTGYGRIIGDKYLKLPYANLVASAHFLHPPLSRKGGPRRAMGTIGAAGARACGPDSVCPWSKAVSAQVRQWQVLYSPVRGSALGPSPTAAAVCFAKKKPARRRFAG